MVHRKILITDAPWGELDIERGLLEPAGYDVVLAASGDESSLLQLAPEMAAIGTCWAKVTEPVIQAAEQCRHIARFGIGLDNIDLPAAAARGMVVTNVPDYCVEEVAEHALGLLLAHARQIAFFHQQTKRGQYALRAAPPMRRLSHQNLGLLGFGRIARRLREMALGVGLSVVAHTPSGDDYGTGCPMVSFTDLLGGCDYLSIHAPLTDQTRHLVDARALAQMRAGAFLINTSRGGLIDHAALWDALHHDRLAGVGLDVFEPEPPDLALPLFQDERVILTPHAAFVSQESLVELRQRAATQLLDVLQGRTPANIVGGV